MDAPQLPFSDNSGSFSAVPILAKESKAPGFDLLVWGLAKLIRYLSGGMTLAPEVAKKVCSSPCMKTAQWARIPEPLRSLDNRDFDKIRLSQRASQ